MPLLLLGTEKNDTNYILKKEEFSLTVTTKSSIF